MEMSWKRWSTSPVSKETEEVSLWVGNCSTLDENKKGQSSTEKNCLWCHNKAVLKEGDSMKDSWSKKKHNIGTFCLQSQCYSSGMRVKTEEPFIIQIYQILCERSLYHFTPPAWILTEICAP
jgi:hypothetical protein